MNEDVVYFGFSDWEAGFDYPDTPNFRELIGDRKNCKFSDDAWCRENKLCVVMAPEGDSWIYSVTAPREWVEKNCPEVLGTDYENIKKSEDEEYFENRYDLYYLDYDPICFGVLRESKSPAQLFEDELNEMCEYDDDEDWEDEDGPTNYGEW